VRITSVEAYLDAPRRARREALDVPLEGCEGDGGEKRPVTVEGKQSVERGGGVRVEPLPEELLLARGGGGEKRGSQRERQEVLDGPRLRHRVTNVRVERRLGRGEVGGGGGAQLRAARRDFLGGLDLPGGSREYKHSKRGRSVT